MRLTFWQRIVGFWRKPAPLHGLRALPSGRVSVDQDRPLFGGGLIIQAPADHESNWRLLNLDSKTLDRIEPARLMEMLADLSPEVSKALWDFLRNCNPGWTAQAYPPDTQMGDQSAQVDENAQAALDAFLTSLRDLYGAADIVFNRLFMAAFLRGAFFAELVLDARGRVPVDIATPDPETVRFKQMSDPIRGQIWQAGQWQIGQFVAFDRPTVRYVPVDPPPGSPYGRALASPSLFSSLFLLGLLHDLRRVVAQQGYPRLDLAIDNEKAYAAFNAAPPLDSTGAAIPFATFAGNLIDQIQTVYAALEPDDAYIHTDVVTVNRPVGTVDTASLGAISGLIEALERMAVRALKSMPFALGLSESTTETQSNRQYELYAAGIKSLQHYAENLLERLFGLALEAQGIQATVRVRFAELRSAERLRDAQADALEIANEARKRDEGWIEQDEASEAITGHKAAAPGKLAQATTPLVVSGGNQAMPVILHTNGAHGLDG